MTPENLLLICSGTHDQAAYEDTLAAGALCDSIWHNLDPDGIADSAKMARDLYQPAAKNLLAVASQSRNGMRLSAIPELADDVPFCLQRNLFDFPAALNADGQVVKL
jgi:phosphosulfolactate phosphohydrolase-like enzyme